MNARKAENLSKHANNFLAATVQSEFNAKQLMHVPCVVGGSNFAKFDVRTSVFGDFGKPCTTDCCKLVTWKTQRRKDARVWQACGSRRGCHHLVSASAQPLPFRFRGIHFAALRLCAFALSGCCTLTAKERRDHNDFSRLCSLCSFVAKILRRLKDLLPWRR